MKVTLTRVTTKPVMAIEEAACNCYNSTPSEDGKIMNACYKNGHKSVLEFVDFTFHIEDVSRSLLAQLTRHRISSFAVRSQRYVVETNINWIVPETIKNNPEALQLFNDFHNQTEQTYHKLLDLEIPAEDARYILTNACPTILQVKMDLTALIHFMNERLCSRAQWEIRELAIKMKQEIVKDYPQFSKMLVPKCEMYSPYCFCTEQKSCGRHPKLKEVYKTED